MRDMISKDGVQLLKTLATSKMSILEVAHCMASLGGKLDCRVGGKNDNFKVCRQVESYLYNSCLKTWIRLQMRCEYIWRWRGVEEDHLLILNLCDENGAKVYVILREEIAVKNFSFFSNVQFAQERKISSVVHNLNLTLVLMCFSLSVLSHLKKGLAFPAMLWIASITFQLMLLSQTTSTIIF